MSQSIVEQIIVAISNDDAEETFNIINKISEKTVDFASVIDQLLELLHQISIALSVPSLGESLSTTIQQILPKLHIEQVQLYYQITIKGKQDLASCSSSQQCFEMICLRQISFKHKQNLTPLTS